ncbi:response regulator [Massilia dura]|uniref:Response regulator n=1 Tax=Pseudoduganella dura TaxID=321982 RepID=A0A6I3X3N9_9BURK|nr:response regulator [Pseudoduganella dura]MUI11484.1 response regulator [Pseudoduganella dura]GGX97430.1 hypothetical protein GCM10007386_30460 [Pseudoduganella dura]
MPLSSLRVLVVDDHADSADALAELLSLYGMAAQAVHDGTRAIALAETFAPDVVLLDLRMPGMDGYAVARALRAMPLAQPYLVAYSALDDARTLAQVRDAGFDCHLPKPSRIAAILRVVYASASALAA